MTLIDESIQSLLENLKIKLNNYFLENNIDIVYLSGSVVTQLSHFRSDIDIFIKVPEEIIKLYQNPNKYFLKLARDINGLFDLRELDVQLLNILPIHVQYNAVVNGITLFRHPLFSEEDYLEQLMNVYFDHIIWYENLLNQSQQI
ncbi:MAG: nucleotidyltransferase domain-containing protein [Candidatus Hodarchaeales archaeon]|jgi:predicted nucleotidyltransferase